MAVAEIHGVEIFHETVGEGESLVLLNGIMMNTQSWALQTRQLATTHRCVLHDFRGQLRSGKPAAPYEMRQHVDDLAALLDALGIDTADVAGTSYGGEVAMMFALAHPRRVRTLTVIACVSHVDPSIRDHVLRWREAALHAPDTLYEVTAPGNFAPSFLSPLVIEAGRERMKSYPSDFYPAFAALCDAFLELDITARLHEIEAPTLVVAGELDVLKPVQYSRMIAERIPRAELRVIEGAGHAVVIEKPAVVNELIEWSTRRVSSPR